MLNFYQNSLKKHTPNHYEFDKRISCKVNTRQLLDQSLRIHGLLKQLKTEPILDKMLKYKPTGFITLVERKEADVPDYLQITNHVN